MKQFLKTVALVCAFSMAASAEFRPLFRSPTTGILEALQQDHENLSTLIGLLKKADLKELRDAKASYTLLAPTNGAFAKLAPVYLAKLTNDPQALGRFLRAHLLPGKVLFSQVFATAPGSTAKKNVTVPLKTIDGGSALLLCDGTHPDNPQKKHHPLVNNSGRILESDIEGTYAVIHVIDSIVESSLGSKKEK